jgi:DNA-binding PadR family transcriptional regulator
MAMSITVAGTPCAQSLPARLAIPAKTIDKKSTDETESVVAAGVDQFLPLKPDVFEILLALKAAPRHGYGILKILEARDISLPASLLYRKLRRLMDDRWVAESRKKPQAGSSDPRRRYYQLTPTGESVLRAEAARIVELARSGHVRRLAQDAKIDNA